MNRKNKRESTAPELAPGPESTPVPPDDALLDETSGFRCTLLYLVHPENAATVRDFGRVLYELILAEPYYPEGDSGLDRELEAVLGDLQHSYAFLDYIARQIEDARLEPPDRRRARLAAEIAGSLRRVIQDLEDGLRSYAEGGTAPRRAERGQ